MPRKIELCEGLERRRLIAMYKQLRGVVQRQLDGLDKSEDGPSAAMLDTLCRSLKQLNSLLDDLAKSETAMDRAERDQEERESIRASLPRSGKTIGNPTEGNNQFPPDPPPSMSIPELELPFPLKGLNG